VANFSKFDKQNGKQIKMQTPAIKGELVVGEGDRRAWGWASTTVRASPEEILAYVWDVNKRSGRYSDDLEKALDEDGNHNQLAYVKKEVAVVKNRDFATRGVWRRVGDGKFVYVSAPAKNGRAPVEDAVRAEFNSAMKLYGAGLNETKLEYLIQPNWGGKVPIWLSNMYVVSNLSYVSEIQEHFQSVRGLQVWDEADGRALAEILVAKSGDKKAEARVMEAFEKSKGLRELGERHDWLPILLTKVVANKLRPAGDSKVKLCNMSVKDAKVIGGALAPSIATNLTAPAAVDEWLLHYPAMGELERE
jgi:hypothetical protein